MFIYFYYLPFFFLPILARDCFISFFNCSSFSSKFSLIQRNAISGLSFKSVNTDNSKSNQYHPSIVCEYTNTFKESKPIIIHYKKVKKKYNFAYARIVKSHCKHISI